jgi:c(7)-type cytochrome triheme protein
MRGGANGISRDGCLAGKFCGACHDGKTAFTVRDADGKKACDRCHLIDPATLDSKFRQFAAILPKAGFGNEIDWQAALAQGLIKPKNSLSGNKPRAEMPAALLKPLALGTGAGRSGVTFSHKEHNAEMDCANCHPDIFNIKKKGTHNFSMETNIYGQYCGTCHMRVAFPMNDCRRCHPEMSNISF